MFHTADNGELLYEAPRSPAEAGSPLRSDKLRGIKAELRRSQPAFALKSFGAVRHAIHPCSKLQGVLAKANKSFCLQKLSCQDRSAGGPSYRIMMETNKSIIEDIASP